jgi:hypothetical protein
MTGGETGKRREEDFRQENEGEWGDGEARGERASDEFIANGKEQGI